VAAFKDQIDAVAAAQLAEVAARAWPAFDRVGFLRGIDAELEPRELLARLDLLAERLAAALPADPTAAAAVLWQMLEVSSAGDPTLEGWLAVACGQCVVRFGLDAQEVALPLLAGLTPRGSSEFAIRPFIEAHPDVTYEHLRRWCDDPDEHVRRLVSEGTRPRLPWAPILRGLVADPTPNLDLLDRLVDDPSTYVRRSVANHLNDIAKDHPALALELAARWWPRSDRAASAVRHGLRTLIKRGDPRALAVVGVAADLPVRVVDLRLHELEVPIGGTATFEATIELDDAWPAPAEVVIDYRVHYQGARGPNAPKVFKLTRRTFAPGERQTLTRRHPFGHVSIRQIRPGPHRIDVQLNGRVAGTVAFDVVEPAS
jgi:3-methyladenine DNA glycosylase AlkC